MFLFTNVDLIFILSFAFLALLIIIWVLALVIAKKYKASHKKPIDYAAKNVHEDLEDNKTEEVTEEKVEETNSAAVIIPTEESVDNPQNKEIEETESQEESESEEIKEENTEVVEETASEPEDIKSEETTDDNVHENNEELTTILDDSTKDEIEEQSVEDNQPTEETSIEKVEESVATEETEAPVEQELSEESNVDTEEKVEPETTVEEQVENPIVEEQADDTAVKEKTLENPEEEKPEVVEEPKEEKPVEKKTINAVPVKKGRTYNGKFEIFEAGDGYAYQLKASNGEILVVSEIYSSRDSVIKAIKALQKNINDGEVKIFADKRGKYKFKLIAKNYKVLVISASYTVYKSAVRASESFKKYVMIADIVDVELDDNESKTATPIQITATEDKMGAKIVIEKFDGEFSWALKATNGEILCQAEGYTSKAGCLYSIDTFKKNIVEGQFRCIKDKNGNYCYKLYTANNRICAVGESYPSKQSAISAANSVVSYYKNAVVEEIK